MPKHKGDEVKTLAVEYMLANPDLTQEEICDIFQCSSVLTEREGL